MEPNSTKFDFSENDYSEELILEYLTSIPDTYQDDDLNWFVSRKNIKDIFEFQKVNEDIIKEVHRIFSSDTLPERLLNLLDQNFNYTPTKNRKVKELIKDKYLVVDEYLYFWISKEDISFAFDDPMYNCGFLKIDSRYSMMNYMHYYGSIKSIEEFKYCSIPLDIIKCITNNDVNRDDLYGRFIYVNFEKFRKNIRYKLDENFWRKLI